MVSHSLLEGEEQAQRVRLPAAGKSELRVKGLAHVKPTADGRHTYNGAAAAAPGGGEGGGGGRGGRGLREFHRKIFSGG